MKVLNIIVEVYTRFQGFAKIKEKYYEYIVEKATDEVRKV